MTFYAASIIILADPIFAQSTHKPPMAAEPHTKKVKRSTVPEAPREPLMNLLDVPEGPMHQMNQFLSLQDITNTRLAGAYGQDGLNDGIEKMAARQPKRDPTMDSYTDFQFVEKKVAKLQLISFSNLESAEKYAQKWKGVLTDLVSHPKFTKAEEAEAEKLNLIKWAIGENQSGTLKAMLVSGSFDPTQHWGTYGEDLNDNNAIELACQEGHLEIAQLLLNWRGDEKQFVDPTINDNNAIELACQEGHLEIVQLLLNWRGGPDEDQYVDPTINDNTAIEFACEEGHLEIVQLLLNWRGGPDEDQYVDPTINNNNAIEFACQEGHLEIVQLLLNWRGGPDGNQYVDPTMNNNNAIVIACLRNHPEIVKLLLEWESPQGDQFVNPTWDDNILLRDLINFENTEDYAEVIHILLQWIKKVEDMVLYVDATVEDNRVLVYAIEKGNVDLLGLLLAWRSPPDRHNIVKQVDPRTHGNYHNKALRDACFGKNIDVVDFLLKWVGPNGEKVNPTDNNYEAFEHVESHIDDPPIGQTADQWKNVLHQFLSLPNLDRAHLLERAKTKKQQHIIDALNEVAK